MLEWWIMKTNVLQNSTIAKLFDRFSGSLIISDASGRIVYTNMAAEKRTGFFRAEMIGENPGNLWGGNMHEDFYRKMWSELQSKKPGHFIVKNTYKNKHAEEDYLNILPIGEHYYAEVQPFAQDAQSYERIKTDLERVDSKIKNKKNGSLSMLGYMLSGTHFSELADLNIFDVLTESLIGSMRTLFVSRQEDKRLVEEAQKDPLNFSHLYEKYVENIYQYMLSRAGFNEEVARDLVQVVFEKAFKNISGFRFSNASYKTYLLRIAHNELVSFYRKKKENAVPREKFEESIEKRFELRNYISDALRKLSKGEQEVVRYKYFEDLKIKEIAKRLSKSENAVKLQLSRARKKLRVFLAQK